MTILKLNKQVQSYSSIYSDKGLHQASSRKRYSPLVCNPHYPFFISPLNSIEQSASHPAIKSIFKFIMEALLICLNSVVSFFSKSSDISLNNSAFIDLSLFNSVLDA